VAGNDVNQVEHWDGRRWNALRALPAAGPGVDGDAQAVGLFGDTVWAAGTVIARWDGRRWATVTTMPDENLANGISGTPRDEGWVVSAFDASIVRWNGHRWTPVPFPSTLEKPRFMSVAAVSADEAWIVGSESEHGQIGHALALRWDGRDWAVVPTAGVGTELDSVALTPSGEVWAGGFAGRYGVVARYSC
jgi:hypothetical protein